RDAGAMRELYDHYGRLIYSLIQRMVRNSAAAEDLVQETFLRIWNRIPAFDQERGALGPWVLTVARNRAIDYLRSTDGRMSAGVLDLDRLEHPAQFVNFDDRALSLDRARVIELAYYEGLSQTEMADRMQQPLGTIKTWVRSALKVLREQLTEAATV